MSNIFKPIHTPCKSCVFAKYENITQTDCFLGFLDKYKKNDTIEIIEAYDEEKEFYVINGKKCFGFKETKYFQSKELENISLEEKIEYIKNKLRINYVCVINIMNFTKEELKDLLSTINNLSVKPQKIILIRYTDNDLKYPFNLLKEYLEEYTKNIKWKIQTIVEHTEQYEQVLHTVINTNKQHNFILSINGDYANLGKIIAHAQSCVYEKFKIFGVLSNKSSTTVFFNNAVYRTAIFHGVDIFDKKEEYEII